MAEVEAASRCSCRKRSTAFGGTGDELAAGANPLSSPISAIGVNGTSRSTKRRVFRLVPKSKKISL